MGKLVFTENTGFDMRDWQNESLQRVYAGSDCIMAITADGRTLQKTTGPDISVRTRYWTRIRDIAISKWAPGLAIGLVSDGTCLIAKKGLRKIVNDWNFDRINGEIKSWKNIVQTAASDSYFGLDGDGRVHAAALNSDAAREYSEVASWTGIRRIVTGTQNSLIGIREDGRLMFAGANLRRGPRGDLAAKLASLQGVTDVYPTGSGCENMLIAFEDGSVRDMDGQEVPVRVPLSKVPAFSRYLDGSFMYQVFILDAERRLYRYAFQESPALSPVFGPEVRVSSFAAGDLGYGEPFVVAVAD